MKPNSFLRAGVSGGKNNDVGLLGVIFFCKRLALINVKALLADVCDE